MSKLDDLIKQFNKEHKDQIAFKGMRKVELSRIPFTSPRMNYMTYGGIARGRITEFAGEEASGKTTSALDIVCNAQRMFLQEWEQQIEQLEIELTNKLSASATKDKENTLNYLRSRGPLKIMYVDSENTLDFEWAEKLGVDVDSLYLIAPFAQSAEEIFQIMLEAMDTAEIGLIILDSIGTLVSQQAMEKTMLEKSYCGIAGSLTTFSNKIMPRLNKFGCTLIGINQVREDINNPYSQYSTSGGKCWKHHCSLRLMFQKGSYIDAKGTEIKRTSESPAGNLVMVNMIKTKVCKPDRRVGFYTLNYSSGVDYVLDTIDVAQKYELIKGTSWYSIIDPLTKSEYLDEHGDIVKVQGKANLSEYLVNNQDLFYRIYNQIAGLML